MPGRFLHLPGNRDPAPREEAAGSRGEPGAAGVPPGAVEGHLPAPARRPAPAGLAGRLDHAGCAGRGASAAGRAGPAAGTGVTGRADAPGVDVIVVGAGMAGLTAAVRRAEAGLRVVTVAKGHGSLRLAPATIDILGYGPGRVDSPTGALPGFVAAHPDHPYSLVTPELLAQSARWLTEHVAAYAYVGDPAVNILLPTALGVPRPSAVVPETMAGGDLRSAGHVAIAGLRALKDFHPALAAENIRAAAAADGLAAEARPLWLSPPTDGEADVTTLGFARRFEDPGFRRAVAAELRAALGDEQAVGLPAVLGVDQVRYVWTELQEAIGRPVFEIPTIPPSVPGIRLAKALQDRLRRAGGRFVLGAQAVGPELRDGRLAGGPDRSAGRETTRMCRRG